MKLNDTTTEEKTADKLVKQMEDVLTLVENDWKVEPIGFSTDAAGDARKARQTMQANPKYSHLVFPDCYAHQASLNFCFKSSLL